MPKVSVIIPVYNVEKYIERCARSLFEQTLDDIEYIFVDDCTPDKSIEILQGIIEDYPARKASTRIIHHSYNKGLGEVRKTGIFEAKGQYIIHCDSDDWADINMLEVMYNEAVTKSADMVVCDFVFHNGNDPIELVRGCNNVNTDRFVKDMMLQHCSWSVWNKLCRRSLYHDGIQYAVGNMGEDMVLILQLALRCKRIAHVNQGLYYYYYNTNSIIHDMSTEHLVKRFHQYYSNYLIIKNAFDTKASANQYKRYLSGIKYNVKNSIFYKQKECMELWRKTFPGIEFKLLFAHYISPSQRIDILRTIFKGHILFR